MADRAAERYRTKHGTRDEFHARRKEEADLRNSRDCAWCQTPFLAVRARQRFCSRRCGAFRVTAKTRTVAPPPVECRQCGGPLPAERTPGLAAWWCSTGCRYQAYKPGLIRNAHVRRARLAEALVEVVDPLVVYERDGWVCQICGFPVDRDTTVKRDPMMASLDHRVPIVRGGDHSYENTQCSHLVCNWRKHAS